MPGRIEDYAFLSDMESAALVGRDGSIDWLTFPRFDSAACFAALLGGPEHGRWLLAPASPIRSTQRRYRGPSLVLETVHTTDEGEVAVVDCMPPRDENLQVVRLVEGRRGRVPMRMELAIRFDYGSIVPWVRNVEGDLLAVGGPDSLRLSTPVHVSGKDFTSVAEFSVGEGDVVPFVMTWFPSHRPARPRDDAHALVQSATDWWNQWASAGVYSGRWADDVKSSLTVLKGLTYAPTGGLVAAATTSLPEQIGGPRNWDYRFSWLRDATFSLLALLAAGYTEEAVSWRDWLLRAVAGSPSDMQIMYGLAGERRLSEYEVKWLPGYERSSPVRTGNAAHKQFQLDVYGEVMDALHQAQSAGIDDERAAFDVQYALLEFLEGAWTEPDEGIWEVRGPREHFTHSKVMAWVAFDRAVRTAELSHRDGGVDRWKAARDDVHRWVLEHGVDDRGVFVQRPGTHDLDASLLMVPLVGFLPATDDRVVRTVEAIERELTVGGFTMRYDTTKIDDGLPPGEGAFLLCTFWLADALAAIGRVEDATAIFERLLALRNDVGLLSEQVDPSTGRFLGNIPQAFSHTALVNTALLLDGSGHTRT